MTTLRGALALALLLATPVAALSATPTPKPHATASKPQPIPAPHLPKVKLHTEFVVEVNKLGQVAIVKSGKDSKDAFFNAQTYGNVLQMWIRHPDGTAEVGLFRVTYDYDPKTAKIDREFSLISSGGDWGDIRGAANQMMDEAAQQKTDAAKRQSGETLPSFNQIVKPSPSAHP